MEISNKNILEVGLLLSVSAISYLAGSRYPCKYVKRVS